MNDQAAQSSYVDSYSPPPSSANDDVPGVAPVSPPPTSTNPNTVLDPVATNTPISASTEEDQKLEDQNIFFLLGVKEEDATDDQRETFLDELQQVIWEDFLENDAQLLLTRDEMKELHGLLDKTKSNKLDDQEEVVVYLEKLIPDLEEIMLEKALELKSDMFKERIAGMREYYQAQPAELAKIEQAEKQMLSSQWLSAAQTLNALR